MIERLPKIRGTYRQNFLLSKVTWFRVGGSAEILFKPKDEDDLLFFLKNLPKDINYSVLGVGSNLLVRDAGIKGVVIRLGQGFVNINHTEDVLVAGAGALDTSVSEYCYDNSLGGLEFLSGIPGVIGAAIAMNAGAYGSEVSDNLIKVEAIDEYGSKRIFSKEECGFKYRGNSLSKNLVFTKAYFKVTNCDKYKIKQELDEIKHKRESSQPVRSKTGGSTFKNPLPYKAWELIDKSGCRGMKIGGASMSEMHCNFLINDGTATADDIETLGEKVREEVYKKTGIKLEWEIKIVGEKSEFKNITNI